MTTNSNQGRFTHHASRLQAYCRQTNGGIETAILLFVSLLVTAVFAALALASFPAADDYCYAVKTQELGFLGSQFHWYESWSGRYTASALMAVFSLADDIAGPYKSIPLATQGLSLIALFVLLIALVGRRFSLPRIALATVSAHAIFLTGIPELAHYFYWAMGVADYASANILVMLLLAIGCFVHLAEGLGKMVMTMLFLAAALVSVLAIGTNEVTLVTVLALVGSALFLSARRRSSRTWFWSGLALVSLAAAIISILAPGNFARMASLANDNAMRPHPLLAFALVIPWFALRLAEWATNPLLWVSGALVLAVFQADAIRLLYRDGKFVGKWLAVPAGWLLLLLALTSIGFAINRHPLPERAEATVWLVFWIGWYPSLIIVAHWLLGAQRLTALDRYKRALVLLLAVCVVGAPHVFMAFKDASYRAIRYKREMDARHELIRAAKARGDTELRVPTLSRPPRTIHVTEITSDPNNFRNSCLAQYYGLARVSF